jgi:hypothetical protein
MKMTALKIYPVFCCCPEINNQTEVGSWLDWPQGDQIKWKNRPKCSSPINFFAKINSKFFYQGKSRPKFLDTSAIFKKKLT